MTKEIRNRKSEIPTARSWVGIRNLALGVLSSFVIRYSGFILRVLFRLYRLFSSLRHRSQKRFTGAGLFVVCALIATAIMGLDTENTIAYQGFTLLLFLLVVAGCFSWFLRVRI